MECDRLFYFKIIQKQILNEIRQEKNNEEESKMDVDDEEEEDDGRMEQV